MQDEYIHDRRMGMFLGLAIGDALGAAVEFCPRGSFERVQHYRAGGPWRLNAGEWTDDTSMALAHADSIINVGWDLRDQAQRYLNWRDSGKYSVNGRCFDIGYTTNAALKNFSAHGDPFRSGLVHAEASGNGSIMRLASIPAAFFNLHKADPLRLVTLAIDSSKVTHASDLCLAATAWMCLALCDLAAGESLWDILSENWPGLGIVACAIDLPDEMIRMLVDVHKHDSHESVPNSGYVLDSLEAALWAVAGASSFESGVLRAVNLGGDADTIGAIAGQFAGAIWGLSGIPQAFITGLAQFQYLHDYASKLAGHSGTVELLVSQNRSSK